MLSIFNEFRKVLDDIMLRAMHSCMGMKAIRGVLLNGMQNITIVLTLIILYQQI